MGGTHTYFTNLLVLTGGRRTHTGMKELRDAQ